MTAKFQRSKGRLTMMAVCAVLVVGTTSAQEMTRFDIQEGPLSGALNTLADDAGLTIIYDGATAADRSTEGLSGSYNYSEALSTLLAGSGLGWRESAGGSVTIFQIIDTA